ncbi:hypothetical protein F1D05_32460 [Kribbella qitaiheensis]|uniref:Uncharacterized protein n=1 Tax=Kribbella qitaiheensis TaxID=1544730 RepID=A0A7G6X6B2_9ACTN|nr:DUF6185 family protein [Kribbella qitaiheensis]QNE21777.1 hypothetical protein F1D05_32460 [Kribbella qitaiheensis]
MKVGRIVAAAMLAGIVIGLAVGWVDEKQYSEGLHQLVSDCPPSGKVDKLTAQLTVGQGLGQQVEVRASASAALSEAGTQWHRTNPDSVPLCVFTNGSTAEYPDYPQFTTLGPPQLAVGQYRQDADAGKLQVSYADTRIQLGAWPAQPSPDVYRRIAPAIVAFREAGVLHLDIALCRSAIGRLACKPTPTSIEVVIADAAQQDGSTVTAVPRPTSVQPDADKRQTSYQWQLDNPATTSITVEIPLPFAMRTTFQAPRTDDLGDISLGSVRFRVNWPTLLAGSSALFALLVTVLVLRRFGQAMNGIRLTLAFAALLIGLATDVVSPWAANGALTAISWTAVTILAADRWRALLIGTSIMGLATAGAGVVANSTGIYPEIVASGLLLSATAGVIAFGTRLQPITHLLPTGSVAGLPSWFGRRIPSIRATLIKGALFALILGSALSVGDISGRQLHQLVRQLRAADADSAAASARARVIADIVADVSSNNIGWVVLSAGVLLVLGLYATRLAVASSYPSTITGAQALALTLLIAIVAPPPTLLWTGVSLPVWLLSWLTLAALVRGPELEPIAADPPSPRDRLVRALAAERSRTALLAVDTKVSKGDASLSAWEAAAAEHHQFYPDDVAKQLFARGPTGSWLRNARTAAWIGALLSTIPVGFYVWNALQTLPSRLPYNGVLYLIVDILGEFGRWIGLAFAFGAIYRRLPTRTGAGKGAAIGLAWSVGAALADLTARWLGIPSNGPWLYVALQTFVFLIALGLAYDLMTMTAAGGSWRRLIDLYRIQTVRQRVAYAGPLVLALIGLIDQVRSGAPSELAEQVLAGLGALLN